MSISISIRINFSGHPVSGFDIAPLVGVNLTTNSSDDLLGEIDNVIDGLPQSVLSQLLQGAAAEIVLPGMSSAASVLIANWHGRFGSFPAIRWAVRGEAGFTWPDEASVSLQSIRDESRMCR